MDPSTARALVALNRRFYTRHAASFSRSRARPWPGWQRLLEVCDRAPASPLSVLDAGCGNGRFAAHLLDSRPGPLDYLGLDVSPELLAAARRELEGRLAPERFVELDLLEDDLRPRLEKRRLDPHPVGDRRFDLVVLLGVYHHVPGFERRCRLLRQLAERLEPGGTLAITIWRYADTARLERKIVPWESLTPEGGDQLDLGQLEPGDLLLDWEGDPNDPRYCHLATDEEIEALLRAVPLPCRERYAADGLATGVYNEYLLWSAA